MKRVKLKSGLEGYQCKLQESYSSFEDWQYCAETYGLHTRLGYKTIVGAWRNNPTVQGGITPSDFRKVKAK